MGRLGLSCPPLTICLYLVHMKFLYLIFLKRNRSTHVAQVQKPPRAPDFSNQQFL